MDQRTVLIVEDDPAIARVLNMMVELHGYTVLNAQDGQEAIRLGEQYRGGISLLLCDVLLENESGPVIAAQIGALCPDLQTVFLSGYPLEVLGERNLLSPELVLSGKAFYLQKPFLPADLFRIMDTIAKRVKPAACMGANHGNAY